MKTQSKFPKRILFYCRPKDESGVRHAFAIDPDSKNQDTAQRWAKHRDFLARPHTVEFDNTGFDNLIIESLTVRDEGGRAYQVVLEHQNERYKFDLREGTLMDVIRNTGIAPGGKLGGSFCFIQFGSQMRIVREYSEEWKEALEFRKIRNSENIGKNDLKIGHMYEKQNGDTSIYIGTIFMRTLELNQTDFRIGRVVPRFLFLENKYYEKDLLKFLNGDSNQEYPYWQIKTQTSHSFKIDHGSLIPFDASVVVEQIKSMAEKLYRHTMAKRLGRSYEEAARCYELKGVSFDKEIEADIEEARTIHTWYQNYQRGHR